jgi:multidrug efflux pump subunit AcrA (membrane-fusion protein)
VDAFPNRPFEGSVLKIEPLAITEQNVTMFAVLVRIDNRAGLLRPGMNAEVEIHVGQREDVLAVPNAALRTPRDVGSAAQVLGRDASAGTGQRGTPAGGSRTRAVDPAFGGRYIVFVKRPGGPEPVWIRTGLTDLDYSEVVEGLEASDSVLILPSASLVQSQQESRERINRITGGGGLPGMQQQQQTTSPGASRAPGGR